jgi:hypothetical protein
MQTALLALNESPDVTQSQSSSYAQRYQGLLDDYDILLSLMGNTETSPDSLADTLIKPRPLSPMALDNEIGQRALQALIKDEDYRVLCKKLKASYSYLTVTIKEGSGVYETRSLDRATTVPLELTGQPKWSDWVAIINKAAQTLGGQIRFDSLFSIPRMALYYGIAPWDPKNAAEHQAAIHALEEKRARHSLELERGIDIDRLTRAPTSKELKAYRAVRKKLPSYSMSIEAFVSKVTHSQIIDVTRQFLPEQQTSLLDYLGRTVLGTLTIEQIRATPTVYLEKILRSAEAQELANRLLQALEWYGGKPGEETAPGIRIKLVAKALRLWLAAPTSENPDVIAGYRWQKPTNWGRSYQAIRAEFESHLFTTKRAGSIKESTLAARLFQSQFPMDFSISDIPPDLSYRSSVVWVNFVHGVNLAQAIDPGLLQRMTFQQLVDFPIQQSANASEEQLELIALARIPPTLEWALANDIILQRNDADYTEEEIQRSITALDNLILELNNAITLLDIDPPERLLIAKREMAKIFGSKAFITDGRKLIEADKYLSGRQKRNVIDTPCLTVPDQAYNFHEVYASGKFHTNKKWIVTTQDGKTRSTRWISLSAERTIQTDSDWGFNEPPRVYFPRGKLLPDIAPLFEAEFKNYLDPTKNAYETLIKSQLVSLPWADRRALEQGEVKVYTLREETVDVAAKDETAAITLPLRARMGLILQATHGSSVCHYELLPRAGVVRPRPDLTDLMCGEIHKKAFVKMIFRSRVNSFVAVRSMSLPLDWDAHKTGSAPKPGATCEAIIDQLGETLSRPAANDDDEALLTLSSPRATQIASFISTNLFFVDEKLLRIAALGETEFDRQSSPKHWLEFFKTFVPFWGSIEDLKSDSVGTRLLGVLGLIVDVVSFAIPLGKFAAGSIRLAAATGKVGIRATLPSFSKISGKLLRSSLKNLNPLDGIPSLLKSTGRGLFRLGSKGLFKLKTVAGTADHYDFIKGMPQVTDPGQWRPRISGDELASVRGIDDVPVRSTGSISTPGYHAVDPLSSKPYGPSLTTGSGNLSLGRSHYSPLEKTNDHVLVELSENSRVREVLEVDGRTTLFIDDVPYRLTDDTLRRADLIDVDDAYKAIPCRVRRAPGSKCETSYVIRDPAPTPDIGSFDDTKDWAPWFGDVIYTPATGRAPMRAASIASHSSLEATLEFKKGIYGRVMVSVPVSGQTLVDNFRVGAIIVEAMDESRHYVFMRLNAGDFYVAERIKGQSVHARLMFKKADTLSKELKKELLVVYTGSLYANNMARIYGINAVERALRTMEEIAIPIGGRANPPSTLNLIKVDTSPGEAVFFDHSTRMIITQLQDGATSWSRSKEAPEAFRQRTVEIFDTLFLETATKRATAGNAVRIDSTMRKLHGLIPRSERSRNPRNIAYAEVNTAAGKREVYVSVSGTQGTTGQLPLFKNNLGADEVRVGETTYFNIDLNETFRITALNVTPEGKLLAVPHTIRDIETYQPTLTRVPTSLDSESKLISVIREKYPDRGQIQSVSVATTMPPCDSCSVVMKEFGYDGGENALNVLWH